MSELGLVYFLERTADRKVLNVCSHGVSKPPRQQATVAVCPDADVRRARAGQRHPAHP